MKYTLYWIFLILGVILLNLVMEGQSEGNVIIACFIWGVLASMFFDLIDKKQKKGGKK